MRATDERHSLTQGLVAIPQRLRLRLLRQLASLALIDRRHIACAITTKTGQIVTIDTPARLGIVRAVVRAVLDYFNGNFAPGDVIFTNDPFSGGVHVQDLSLVKPLFAGSEFVGYGVVQVPLADIGGMALGSYYPLAHEVWAEGIRITPTKLYRGGALQTDALTMLRLNSRLPHLVDTDLEVMRGALEFCQTEVAVVVGQGTHAGYEQVQLDILADTDLQVRTKINSLARGGWSSKSGAVHSCQTPADEVEYRVAVQLSVTDGAVQLDFAGSSAAAPGFINSTAAATTAAALMPFFSAWPAIPVNDGFCRAFSLLIPEDSFLHAKLPTSVGWSPYEPSLTVAQTVASVLSQSQTAQVPLKPVENAFIPPALAFVVTGCGHPGCPFPAVSR
ncbi:MAG: hydantoinase B/oxoprolinase family protein [Candidatus Binatia bacterium]